MMLGESRSGGSDMRDSRGLILAGILVTLCIFMSGCSNRTSIDKAARYYSKGNYIEADRLFMEAVREYPNSLTAHLGYGYNLVALNRKDEALAQFTMAYDALVETGSDNERLKEVARVMFDICFEKGYYSQAADLCELMSTLVNDVDEVRYFRLRDAMLRAQRYKDNEMMYDAWVIAIRDIISYKTYAMEEYYELFTSYGYRNMKAEQLALAEEMDVYMTAHAAYADSFEKLIDVMFESAAITQYVESEYDEDHYFELAEKYINISIDRNMPEEDVLKYKIIIAEHRGNFDTAYKLLGVYLNRYPYDAAATKEREYIRVRIGVNDDTP